MNAPRRGVDLVAALLDAAGSGPAAPQPRARREVNTRQPLLAIRNTPTPAVATNPRGTALVPTDAGTPSDRR